MMTVLGMSSAMGVWLKAFCKYILEKIFLPCKHTKKSSSRDMGCLSGTVCAFSRL